MLGIVLGWAFAAFIYFKVALDASFYRGVSVLGALIMAGILGVLVLFSSGFYTVQLAKYNVRALASGHSVAKAIGYTVLVFVISTVAYIAISRLVVFGFSKELSREIGTAIYRRRGFDERFITFALITALPLALHYVLILFNSKRMGRDLDY
jgi:hypothetical protein